MSSMPAEAHRRRRCGESKKWKGAGPEAKAELQASTLVPIHPLEIKPLGNAYTTNENIKDKIGAFARLPDELIIQVFEWLDAVVLLRLSCTCKAMYAFSRQEDLWKALCLR